MRIFDRGSSARFSPMRAIALAAIVGLSVVCATGCGNNTPPKPPTTPLMPGASGAPGPSASHSSSGGSRLNGMPGASGAPK